MEIPELNLSEIGLQKVEEPSDTELLNFGNNLKKVSRFIWYFLNILKESLGIFYS